MNRPNTKNYRRNRRAKWNNSLLVWLFVFLATLIMVPIQAVDEEPSKKETAQVEEVEETETETEEEETP